MRVFKFRGGNDRTLCRDVKTLVRDQFYASAFSTLNDPFEGRAVVGSESFCVESDLRKQLTPSQREMLQAGVVP